jgi:hypothetical protein
VAKSSVPTSARLSAAVSSTSCAAATGIDTSQDLRRGAREARGRAGDGRPVTARRRRRGARRLRLQGRERGDGRGPRRKPARCPESPRPSCRAASVRGAHQQAARSASGTPRLAR